MNRMLLLWLLLIPGKLLAQLIWHQPFNQAYSVIQGRAPLAETPNSFQRLPNALKDEVRAPVWSLGQNTAGIYIEFSTDAADIVLRYQVTGSLNMPHMPTTGVSGVDLYAKQPQGEWAWAPGKYVFKDTISYRFEKLNVKPMQRLRLYLPLYNSVKWLEIGVEKGRKFIFHPTIEDKPIIVYGTSIAQGGCASRPGLAWPSIFARKVNSSLINLAFSGNGRLETPILNLIANTSSKLIVLDCMPNLGSRTLYPEAEIRKRVLEALKIIRSKQAKTPILFVEHSGGGNQLLLDTVKKNEHHTSSVIIRKVFNELKKQGHKDIYLLTNEAINLSIEATVDGTHPNDLGMMEHAIAFEKMYRQIFPNAKKL